MRSSVGIVFAFLVAFLTIYLMGYPYLIHHLVVGFYSGNPSFFGFVIGTIETAGLIGQVLSPIGWLASAINGVLISASLGFRFSLEGFIAYLTGPLRDLGMIWMYVICQNTAAWFSAIVVLVYIEFTAQTYRRYRR
jgi:hypothetical protein